MMEDHDVINKIEVGTRLTEYHYTDRDVYEVVEVKDQKHVAIRRMIALAIGQPMSNKWELKSDETAPAEPLVKRGKYWYYQTTVSYDDYEKNKDNVNFLLALVHMGITPDGLKRKGKVTKYHRAHVSFGIADYHIDYEF
jgi:hypothetical protein